MAQIKVEMTADQAKLFREFAKQQRQIDRLETGYKKVGRAGKRSADQTTGAFGKLDAKLQKTIGRENLGNIKQFAGAFVGVGAAIGGVTAALADMQRRQNEAIQGAKDLFDVRRNLSQISGSPEEFQSFIKQSQRLAGRSMLNEKKASDLLFTAKSQGFTKDVNFLAALSSVLKTDQSAKLAGKIPGLFQPGAISSRESINAALRASQPSDINTGAFAGALPVAAESANELGTKPAELFAALSRLSPQFASPKTAADRLKAFQSQMALKGFRGQGLVSTIKEIQGLSPEDRKELLGQSQELNIAFGRLSGSLDKIKSLRSEVRLAMESTGTEQSVARQRLRTRLSDKDARAQIALAMSESKLSIEERKQLAASGAMARSSIRDMEAAAMRDGSPMRAFMAKWSGEASVFGGASPTEASLASFVGATSQFNPQAEFNRSVIEVIRRLAGGEPTERQQALARGLRGDENITEQQQQLLDEERQLLEEKKETARIEREAAEARAGGPTGVPPEQDM